MTRMIVWVDLQKGNERLCHLQKDSGERFVVE